MYFGLIGLLMILFDEIFELPLKKNRVHKALSPLESF